MLQIIEVYSHFKPEASLLYDCQAATHSLRNGMDNDIDRRALSRSPVFGQPGDGSDVFLYHQPLRFG